METNGHNKLNLNLDYGNNGDGPSGIELSNDYINYAVTNVHRDGLDGQMRRIFGRIQRKLDKAVEGKLPEIELEKAEQDLLRTAFRDCKVPAQFSKFFVVLEEEIERVTKS